MNVLLVEDQQRLARALAAILEEAGCHVDMTFDGLSGLDYALHESYDAIVLDVMLPKKDGFEVIKELRRENSEVPVIMLTARDTLQDKVTGLDLGADDDLTKPFQPTELLARLRALTRRQGQVIVETLEAGNTVLDLQTADLVIKGNEHEPVHLSQREFEVCKWFMANVDKTISKAALHSHVWGMDTDTYENSVEAYVSFLRKKLKFIKSNLQIKTLRMMGYRMEVSD
ncbi:MAG: response regulator transcription factor [Coriobacteriales bacterium]|nr:response regulator transcription factor [Coriobacteriales bacterium]